MEIEKILDMYEDDYNPGPRPMNQGPRNMAQGGRIPFGDGLSVDPERDSFKKISNVIGAYNRYKRGEKNPKLNFNQFFELYSTENFADGGRIPFENGKKVSPNNLAKSEASYKVYEDKFGKELLDKAAQDKYGKNFRDLDKTNELKFFKSQVNKYEDFIKWLKKRYYLSIILLL